MGEATAVLDRLNARVERAQTSDRELARIVGVTVEEMDADTTARDLCACDLCGDYGRLGRHNGETVYCACRAGIAAELADRDRVLSHIADALESMPVAESNKVERRTLWAHFSILREEYDQIERSRWMAVAVVA